MSNNKSETTALKLNKDVHAKFIKFADQAGLKLQSATERALVEFMQNNRKLVIKRKS